MSDPPTEVTSPTGDLPNEPTGGTVAVDIAVEEGTLISDPVDERIAAALLQARTLVTADDEESVASELQLLLLLQLSLQVHLQSLRSLLLVASL
jgi:hypothetical protein